MKVMQKTMKVKIDYETFDINSVEIGSSSPFDILIKRRNNYVIIIEAETLITEKLYKTLEKQEILYIEKNSLHKRELSCKTLNEHVKANKNDFKKSLEILYKINNSLFENYLNSKENIIDVECITTVIKSIIFLVKNNQDYLKETIPYFSSDHELAHHSLHVTIYSINLGNILKFSDEQLTLLGTAAILHDLGLKKVNSSIITKESSLDLHELEMIRKHSTYSVEIVQKNSIHNPYIIDAISHHHECNDGSGYPDALQENEISDFAAILSISDVFDALTNNRPHREKHNSFQALTLMMKDESMINKFNHKFLKKFLNSLVH